MKSKVLLVATAASALFLAGCANNDDLAAQVSALSNKVDSLQADVQADQQRQDRDISAAKAAADDAAAEAMRANQRIDNIATSYKK
ncbi:MULTISPECIES: Lpp/OprI family alanine-zipper lipoprotein [Ferrimonas]|uniref:Lpp/OprI family alanine-zipper lipoprotein n=1 Tax=Ferrimonas TaxID=44011 RepID=UPI00041BB9D3|nr:MULTISPECIES: Lpp/OprI family alanine-zipper lipoprotein [Ferrimonas]USD39091.1 hypothetical protein J8Z22_08335 [Ferrimonas sp. SCSIO 43195]